MGVFRHAFDVDGTEAGKVEVTGIVVKTTPRGILFDDGKQHVWLPKSKVKVIPGKAEFADVLMPVWLARKLGYV